MKVRSTIVIDFELPNSFDLPSRDTICELFQERWTDALKVGQVHVFHAIIDRPDPDTIINKVREKIQNGNNIN